MALAIGSHLSWSVALFSWFLSVFTVVYSGQTDKCPTWICV